MHAQNQPPKITVAIRKRPINKKQQQKGETDIIRIHDQGSVVVSEIKQKVDLTKYIEETTFNFDFAFDQKSNNQHIYDSCIQPLIDSAFMGAKVSCFAYGQTGSGKTFTMRGDNETPGLYYLGAREIFRYLDHPNFQNLQVHVSFFEIYCGKLFDLLNNRAQLKIREDKKNNINIIGMEEKYICSAGEFLQVIEYGSTFRVTSQNATNADSSRSHAILQIILKQGKKQFTKISFIDLAGNERGADHMDQNKQTKIDGAEINKSLLALKQCIRALDQGKGHTPFRGSKLTMVLKDSFVGFCKTVMIGTVSPNVSSAQNTMNTLRYADRVKQLKNSNQAGTLTRQQQMARQMMLPRANKNILKVSISKDDDLDDIEAKKQAARRNMKRNTQKDTEMDIQSVPMPMPMPVPVPRRRTDVLPSNQDNPLRSQPSRKSLNQLFQHSSQPQDQNNPKNRHINFINGKEIKNIDIKLQPRVNSSDAPSSHNLNRNKLYGLPRTEKPVENVYKMQLDYHHMMQEIENMKQQFFNDHFQAIKEESYMIKQESEHCDKALRTSDVDMCAYLEQFQKKMARKMEMFSDMKRKAEYLCSRIQESQHMGKVVSEMTSLDEQLLEGLPNQDFGGRLF